MKPNMGTADRLIRLLIVVVIAALYFMHLISGTLAIVALAVAAIFLVTSLVSYCPLYSAIKVSTRKKDGSA